MNKDQWYILKPYYLKALPKDFVPLYCPSNECAKYHQTGYRHLDRGRGFKKQNGF